jgi:hypothetical protein
MSSKSVRSMKLLTVLLFFGVLAWLPPAAMFAVLMQLLVCGAAIFLLARSFQKGRPALGFAFVLVAAVFNPFILHGLSRPLFLVLAAGVFALFAFFVLTQQHQRLSMASITDRVPGSESL